MAAEKSTLLILAGLVLAGLTVGHEETDIAVDLTTEDGIHVKIPYFNGKFELPTEWDCNWRGWRYIEKVIKAACGNNQKRMVNSMSDLWAKIYHLNGLIDHCGADYERVGRMTSNKQFIEEQSTLMKSIEMKTKQIVRQMYGTRIDSDELLKEVQKFNLVMRKSIESSSIFIDWNAAKIDGKPFDEFAAALYSKILLHEVGKIQMKGEMDIAFKLLSRSSSWKTKGKKFLFTAKTAGFRVLH